MSVANAVNPRRLIVAILFVGMVGLVGWSVYRKSAMPRIFVRVQLLWQAQGLHNHGVASVAFSSDGRILATAGADGTVQLRDSQSGRLLKVLKGHRDVIWSVAFSPSSRILASGGVGNPPMLWDVKAGKPLRKLDGHTTVLRVAFSPDGETLATSYANDQLCLWKVSSGRLVRTLTGCGGFRLTFSPDGKTLACGGPGNTLKLLDPSTGKLKQTLGGCVGDAIAFSPDGKILVSPHVRGVIYRWDVQSGKRLRRICWTGITHPHLVAFSPDGKILAITGIKGPSRLWRIGSARPSEGVVVLSDADRGGELWSLPVDGKRVLSVTFSPDGKLLAVGLVEGTVKVWRIRYIEKPSPR